MAQAEKTDSNEAIGDRLKLVRLAYGALQNPLHPMSQAEFCRLCGISRAAWNNAETGDNRIGLDNAKLVRQRTGVGLDYIYEGDMRALPHAIAMEINRLLATKPAKRA